MVATGRRVAIIGAGRVGSAMASLLHSRGYDITAVWDPSPEARRRAAELGGAVEASGSAGAALEADVVLITTPDDRIAEACREAAEASVDLSGKTFLHMSGALSLDALEPAALKGARVASVHPLQTFADTAGALEALPGSTFGVTCAPNIEEWARAFVADLDGTYQAVEDSDKVLYHAAAVMACNFLTIVEYGALALARASGFDEGAFTSAFMPLARATAANVERLGPAGALTGPLARGDVDTIRKHLEALDRVDSELAAMYRAVCLWGLKLVGERGDTDRETIELMRDLLEGSGQD